MHRNFQIFILHLKQYIRFLMFFDANNFQSLECYQFFEFYQFSKCNQSPEYYQSPECYQSPCYQSSECYSANESVSTQADSSDGSEDLSISQIIKYKTETCKNFAFQGYCTYGDKCQFAHGVYQLNLLSLSQLYKTKKCKNFWKKGFCLYGVRCQFLHCECDIRPSSLDQAKYLKRKKLNYLELQTESRLLKIV